MSLHKHLILALGLALLGGCTGVAVRYDYDRQATFSTYKTYDWYAASPQAKGKARNVDNPLMDRRVRQAVERELGARGYQLLKSGEPDFLLTYYPVYQDRAVVTSTGLYPAWGWHPMGFGMATQFREVQHFREGSIALEVLDGKSRQVVWQAVGEGALSGLEDPRDADERVGNAVRQILAKFPPNPAR
jgi:hypothetical protein